VATLVLVAAEEPSKVPFHVVGGALAPWAVAVGGVGLRRPDSRATPAVGRAGMAISAVPAAAAMAMAVVTS
jgi:hypothetical protein